MPKDYINPALSEEEKRLVDTINPALSPRERLLADTINPALTPEERIAVADYRTKLAQHPTSVQARIVAARKALAKQALPEEE